MNRYKGKVKRFGIEYTKRTEYQMTDKNEVLQCPLCSKSIGLRFVDEAVQLGFDGYNQYQEFFWCDLCDKGHVMIAVRKGEVYFGR